MGPIFLDGEKGNKKKEKFILPKKKSLENLFNITDSFYLDIKNENIN